MSWIRRALMLAAPSLAACATGEVAPGEPGPREAASTGEAAPVTSDACAGCHPDEHRIWAGSHHALAQRPVDAEAPPFADEDGALLRDLGPDGAPAAFPVRWTVGVAPLQQFVVPSEDGRFQVGQRAWDPDRAEWFDVFGDGRRPGEWGHWTGRGMTWNTMCAGCHTTGFEAGYDPASDGFASHWDELGVGCAGCHDTSAHAGGDGPVPPVSQASCAVCHSRGAVLAEGFGPGRSWLDHALPAVPDTTDAFWATGAVREELFEQVAFRSSRMAEVGVRCVDCHEPHSGELRREGDALCAGCHAADGALAGHDHHDGAVACVDCHMPTTTYMQRHVRRDHGLSIPDPELATEVGAPSACDGCHDEPVVEAARRWWPDLADRPHRARARAVAAARAGSGPELQLAALAEAPPHWRGVLLGLLGPWADADLRVRRQLVAAVADPDPWIRLGAARGLAAGRHPEVETALRGLIDDPVRAVRFEAILGLRHRFPPDAPEVAEVRAWLEAGASQPAARTTLGTWYLAHGGVAEAEPLLRSAVELDPTGSAARSALVVLLARAGRPEEAVAVLEEGVAATPDDGDLWFRLGLARVGVGRVDEGEVALERAVKVDPEHGRAWYNLGLARDGRQDRAGARQALLRAAAVDPASPDALWALSTIEARYGDVEESRRLAREVLARAPAHRDARRWLDASAGQPARAAGQAGAPQAGKAPGQ